MASTQGESTLVLAPGVGCSRLGAEVVLLDPSGQTLRGVNARGAQVLALLDGRRSVSQVGVELDAPREVTAFLSELQQAGLVVAAQEPVTPAIAFAASAGVPEILWQQRFVGLQELSDPCMQQPPPGYCGDFGGP